MIIGTATNKQNINNNNEKNPSENFSKKYMYEMQKELKRKKER